MAPKRPRYPFVPKSSSYLEPGQFWAIPLSNGAFAAGRVLQLFPKGHLMAPRGFYGGLMDWSGAAPPSSDDLAGRRILREGDMHVKVVQQTGGEILGCRPLELDDIEPGLFLDQAPDSPNCKVQRGITVLGSATPEQRATLQTHSTWGLRVIVLLAERFFVRGEATHAG